MIDAGGFAAVVGGHVAIVFDVFLAIGALLLLYALAGTLRRPAALNTLAAGGGAAAHASHRTPR